MSAHVQIDSKLVLINSASAVVQRLLSVSVLVWLQQYLVRRISAEEYGIYQVVLALLVFVPLVAAVFGSGLARFVTEAYAQGRFDRVTSIASTSAIACAAGGLAILVIGLALVWQLERVINVSAALAADARWMLGLLTVLAALRMVTMPFTVGLHVKQKFVWINGIALVTELIRIGGLFVLLFGVSTRALWVVVATVPATLFEVAFSVWLSHRVVPALRFARAAVATELLGPILSFGGWTLLGRIGAAAREAAGPLFLNRFSTPVAVTTHSLGAMVESRLFPNIIHPMITTLPILTAMHATGQLHRLKLSYYRLTRYLAWMFLAVRAPLVVFRDELWRLYLGSTYPEYAAAGLVMLLLLIKVVLVFPQPAIAQIAAAKDRTRPMGIRVIVIEGATVLATLYLVAGRGMGAVGPAVATLVVAAIGAPLLHWTLGLELTGGRFGEWWRATLRPGLVPVLVALPVWMGLRWWLRPESWLEVTLPVLAGLLIYTGVLLSFCLQEDDRGDVDRVIRSLGSLLGIVNGRR
jgi:O-antigen/teichoic acid export membrane protein